MKQVILAFFVAFLAKSDTKSLGEIAQDAIAKSILGNEPLVHFSKASLKYYSPSLGNNRKFKKLHPNDLFLIAKNSDLLEMVYGKHAKLHGVIVFKSAMETRYKLNELRFVHDGTEISRAQADAMKINKSDFVIIKGQSKELVVLYINTRH